MLVIIKKAFFSFLLLGSFPYLANCQYYRVDTTQTAEWLISEFFLKDHASGIQLKNIKFTGEKKSLGYFIYKGEFKVLPSDGLILSTGNAIDSEGSLGNIASTENHSDGDIDIEMIVNNKSYDAAIIEFDFMSFSDSVSFSYVFASEEYPEYVNFGVSDAFAFLVSEKDDNKKINLATLPNSSIPITIDLINSKTNNQYFIANSHIDFVNQNYSEAVSRFYYENKRLFEFDGLTVVLETGLKLKPFTIYHFKIVIADVGDMKFDSWVLLKGNSFRSCGLKTKPSKQQILEYFNEFSNDTLNIYEANNTISIETPIYFEFDSDKLNNSAQIIIDHIITILNNTDFTLEINGYADKIGNSKYNIELSKQRANAVKNYIISKGISAKRIESTGKGVLELQDDHLSRKVQFIFK
ncbi:MAG: choice-of-anchor L domain-containing protein [Bacteroidales bacterium]